MSLYHESQDRIASAEAALSGGRVEEARRMFAEAAELQRRMVAGLPEDRVKTKSVFGLSVASLYYKAGMLDEAKRTAYLLLAEHWVLPGSRQGLEQLVSRVWNEEQMALAGWEPGDEPLSITLTGGHVLHGLAPRDVVDRATRTATSYLRRVAAWLVGDVFERQAPPARDAREMYRAWQTQPQAGSYRVDVCLTRQQLTLEFEERGLRAPRPKEIMDEALEIGRMARNGDLSGVERRVSDRTYRKAFVRLLAQLAPDGVVVDEVELRRRDETREESLTFLPRHRTAAKQMVDWWNAEDRATAGEDRQRQCEGVLRGVDLDKDTRIIGDDLTEHRIDVPDDMSDIVGPMLNKRVVASGLLVGRSRAKWTLTDIELAPDQE